MPHAKGTSSVKIYTYPSAIAAKKIATIINRRLAFRQKDIAAVTRIIANVRKNGDQALIDYTRRFDTATLQTRALKVTLEEMRAARKNVPKAFVRSLNRAAGHIRSFHQQQLRNSWFDSDRPGTLRGQIFTPIDAAGIYIPGGKSGKTPLISSVLMCAIPAKIAGVKQIIMATPPQPDGTINPHLLFAAQKVGVDAVYKMGSAWAIAALAYGTATVPRVDMIVGPGNIYVALAKKILSGTVGTDIVAGPSEILVIADTSAQAEYIAADLLSQAEHDVLASAVLVTPSKILARAVADAIETQLKSLARRDIAQKALARYGALLVVADLGTAFDLANRIAPEHLELQIKDPFDHLDQIRHAGAVFIGNYTPEPVGDYIAGPNHVLPTAGTARFASALCVDNFIKATSLIHYSQAAFRKAAPDIIRLARIEGLDAHAYAAKIRLK